MKLQAIIYLKNLRMFCGIGKSIVISIDKMVSCFHSPIALAAYLFLLAIISCKLVCYSLDLSHSFWYMHRVKKRVTSQLHNKSLLSMICCQSYLYNFKLFNISYTFCFLSACFHIIFVSFFLHMNWTVKLNKATLSMDMQLKCDRIWKEKRNQNYL